MAKLRITPEALESLLHLEGMTITGASFEYFGQTPIIELQVTGDNLPAEADLFVTFYSHDCGGDQWFRTHTKTLAPMGE